MSDGVTWGVSRLIANVDVDGSSAMIYAGWRDNIQVWFTSVTGRQHYPTWFAARDAVVAHFRPPQPIVVHKPAQRVRKDWE